jgi:hypothetical protein
MSLKLPPAAAVISSFLHHSYLRQERFSLARRVQFLATFAQIFFQRRGKWVNFIGML